MAVLEAACQAPVVESLEEAETEKPVAGSMPGGREEAAATSVVICGPSGVGKGTLINKLMKEFPESFGFAVSHTTRMPRQGEKDSVHYHFTTRNVMEADIQEARFLESADVHGNLYGTSIAAVDAVARAGKRCLLDIDVQGAQQVKKSQVGSSSLFIFVAPPSFEELERRLRGRGTEKEEQIQKRLKNAKAELEQGKNVSLFDHVLVNDNIEEAYSSLKRILGLESIPASVVYQNGSCENGSAHEKDAAHQNGAVLAHSPAHDNL